MAGFPASALARATAGRYISLPRGDLAASIFARVEGRVETIFADSISAMVEGDHGVQTIFASGVQREFDLVVGADGLHSRVRELAFGPEERFEGFLGYKAAAFGIEATGQEMNRSMSCTLKWANRSRAFQCVMIGPCFCSHLQIRVRTAGTLLLKRPC